jgi:hypothetical protein
MTKVSLDNIDTRKHEMKHLLNVELVWYTLEIIGSYVNFRRKQTTESMIFFVSELPKNTNKADLDRPPMGVELEK